MGLGTYPRVYRARADGHPAPSDFRAERDAGRSWLTISPGDWVFYFGQKVLAAAEGDYRLSLDLRLPAGAAGVTAFLCEKMLLYSDHCSSVDLTSSQPNEWEHKTAVLAMPELAPPALFGLLRRPVELSFGALGRATSFQLAAIRLVAPNRDQLVQNGDFRAGTARWYFTDDFHSAWRMFNQFLMLLFEQGSLGVLAHIVLVGAALFGFWRAILAGNRAAAAPAGAIAAFFCAGLLEAPLEAPRLATLFYLLCFAGLLGSATVPPARREDEAKP